MNEPIQFSNSMRLSPRQWLGIILFTVVLVVAAPRLWTLYEPFSLAPDQRMPRELSNDYWHFERYARLAAESHDVVILGDSVVWGEYVKADETLSHYLNVEAGRERFANLGIEGAHPLALAGLVQHYARSISDKDVIVQFNPLWMTSPGADLSDDSNKPVHHHPDLIPQFSPWVPRYQQDISGRLGVLAQQRSEFIQWTRHLQHAYYDHKDIPAWTVQHPYANPMARLTGTLPPVESSRRHELIPWFKNDSTKVAFDWVTPDQSMQWQAFQDVIDTLQRRGNRVFVVGPFNEHMLTPANLERYREIKATVNAWLVAKQIAHIMPDALPSEEYGDASHPLPAGYARLARQLSAEPFFREGR